MNGQNSIKRHGSVAGVKADMVARYQELHAAAWPEVLAVIRRSNIRNYSIFLREPERYANHKDLVKRVLSGEAPAELPKLLIDYFRLTPDTWGKDVYNGDYDWLRTRQNSAA